MKRSSSPTEPAARLFDLFPTSHRGLRETLEVAARAAPAGANILITGPSGSGKSRLAAAIHAISGAAGPMVEVNCAAIPRDLFEAELFGYEKGAFTDAQERRRGLVERAHEGFLYLDEIADLPVEIQPKLLRFVQDGTFRRLGGIAELRVRCRLISATSLTRPGEDDHLRADLLYRLDVIRLALPSLSERKKDIRELAEQILEEESERPRRLSEGAVEALERHPWRGNVRELRNQIRRALISTSSEVIDRDDLDLAIDEGSLLEHGAENRWNLEQLEKAYIAEVLRETGRNYSAAAKILGINRKTLLAKRKRYGLDE